jgi:hypothetical protein
LVVERAVTAKLKEMKDVPMKQRRAMKPVAVSMYFYRISDELVAKAMESSPALVAARAALDHQEYQLLAPPWADSLRDAGVLGRLTEFVIYLGSKRVAVGPSPA